MSNQDSPAEPVEQPFRSAFWDDLEEDLKDPKFAQLYEEETAKVREALTMITEEAVEAAALSIQHIYPERATEIARKALEAALPYLLVLSWDGGFHAITGTPVPYDLLYKEQETEAAARAIYGDSEARASWHELDYRLTWTYREDAILIVKAATPFLPILKEAFEIGAHTATTDAKALNPYKTRPRVKPIS